MRSKPATAPKSIRWTHAEWERIQDAAWHYSQRLGVPVATTDFVREAARRFCNEVMSGRALAGATPPEEQER